MGAFEEDQQNSGLLLTLEKIPNYTGDNYYKNKNVCVTDMEFESFEMHEQAFKEFFAKLKLPIYFKPHEFEEGKIKALEKMGAKLTEDTENVTIWWNKEDKRVWKFEE